MGRETEGQRERGGGREGAVADSVKKITRPIFI